MSEKAQVGPHTFEDVAFLVEEGQKVDLIDGVLYIAPPDVPAINLLLGWLSAVLTCFVQKKKLGTVVSSRVALRLDDRNGPEPDIAFVRKDHADLIQPTYIAGGADLVIEIVSPESVSRDYQKKRSQYQRAGIPEYWIIDPQERRVTVLSLGPTGRYRQSPSRKEEVHGLVVPGFWLRKEWLWANPLPDIEDVLAIIRARSE